MFYEALRPFVCYLKNALLAIGVFFLSILQITVSVLQNIINKITVFIINWYWLICLYFVSNLNTAQTETSEICVIPLIEMCYFAVLVIILFSFFLLFPYTARSKIVLSDFFFCPCDILDCQIQSCS